MRRTTLALDEKLLRRLKQEAAEQDRTLAELVNDLLRAAMAARAARPKFRLNLPTFPTGPQEGVDLADRNQLTDLMDEKKP